MSEAQTKKRDTLLAILVACAMYVGALFLFLPSPEEIVYWRQSSIINVGKPTNEFDEIVSRIKTEIGQENVEIKVIIGPYFDYLGLIAVLYDEFAPTYFVLIDEGFYSELTTEEKEALVAHESGHILYKPARNSSRNEITKFQVLADSFGAKFVHPQHLKSLLRKANYDYLTRMANLEKLEQSIE